jgi:hypothetical protein
MNNTIIVKNTSGKNTSTDIYFLLNLPALTSSAGYRTLNHLKDVTATPYKFLIENLNNDQLTLLNGTLLRTYIQIDYPELLL